MPSKSLSRSQRRRKQQRQQEAIPVDRKIVFGKLTGSGVVNFESSNAQKNSPLFSKLPVEIRAQIYIELWRQAGVEQHIIVTNVGEVATFRHARCVTEYDMHSYLYPESKSPADGRARCCCECAEIFDYKVRMKRSSNQPASPKSPFLPVLLSCKLIHLEALPSIAHNVRLCFRSVQGSWTFLESHRPPIMHLLRDILFTDCFRLGCWKDKDWSRLLETLGKLPNLRSLYIYMDKFCQPWSDSKPRQMLANPRLCVCFAKVPTHISVSVSVPSEMITGGLGPLWPTTLGHFVRASGGLVNAATMEMVLGEETSSV